ncbi:MAG: efflux RND transporter permease subunit, partial [Phormidesmis sp.]
MAQSKANSKANAGRSRFNLSRLAITHSWLTICCWIAIAVAGLFAFSSLKYALLPDITFPVVVVSATSPAETALESEAQLANPLEESLRQIEGVNLFESSISAGRSVTTLHFKVGSSLAASATAVEQTIAQIDLPAAASYEVIPLNLNEATAISYALSSETLTLPELADLARAELLPPLQEIATVLRVDLLGTGLGTGAEAASSDALDTAESALSNLQNPPTLIRFDQEAAIALQIVKRPEANTLEVVDQAEA